MCDEVANPADTGILKQRYQQTTMQIITPANEELTIHPRTGGLQGDGIMAPMLSAAYDKMLEQWIIEKHQDARYGLISAIGPGTGKEEQLHTTVFADDVAETHLIRTLDDFVEIHDRHNSTLDEILAEAKMAQNQSKAEQVPTYIGYGAAKLTRAMGQLPQEKYGKTVKVARYLGNWFESEGSVKDLISKRIKTMQENYYTMSGLWKNKEVTITTRKQTYKSLIYNTGLAGMDSEVLTKNEYIRLDGAQLRLLRKMDGNRHSIEREDGNKHICSNNKLREVYEIATYESELRKRRLQMWADVLWHAFVMCQSLQSGVECELASPKYVCFVVI